jgi:hypothetical protein
VTKAQVLVFSAVCLALLGAGILVPAPAGPALLTTAMVVSAIGVVMTIYDNNRRRR